MPKLLTTALTLFRELHEKIPISFVGELRLLVDLIRLGLAILSFRKERKVKNLRKKRRKT